MQRIDLNNKSVCCGCGACAFTCPSKAIAMQPDEEGYLYPVINEDRCTNCGVCLKNCSMQNEQAIGTLYNDITTYAVKHKKDKVRYNSRSGGVFTAISDWVFDNDGLVYGALQDRPDHVMLVRASNQKERDELRGSKYVQSHSEHIFELLRDDLKSGRIVLFTGTPCQCASVATVFDPNRYANLYLCDFVCHGVPSETLLVDYLRWVEKKYHSTVKAFVFRDKDKYSWESHFEKIILESKTIYSQRYAKLFACNCCLRPSCYSCKYTSISRKTDFTIADYWGIKNIESNFYDEKGVSLLILRSEKANKVFDGIIDKIDYINTTGKKLEHYNLYRPTKKPDNREKFWNDYHKKGFEFISKKYGSYDLAHRIKHKLIDHYD